MLKSVAIVTGASQGIGRATAIRLAGDFEAVVLTARQEDELKKTAAAVESAGASATLRAFVFAPRFSDRPLHQDYSDVVRDNPARPGELLHLQRQGSGR